MALDVMIIGLGQIGMGYDIALDPIEYAYSHARAFSQHAEFELLGGVDPDRQRREIFSRTFGRPAYANVESALTKHRPIVVIIAVPTRLHGVIVKEVLSLSRPLAMLCEKPLSYDLAEAQEIVQSCAAQNVSLYVNYMRRSDVGVIEVKRRLDAGEIGLPVKGVAWYSKGLQHNGSHFVNLLEYWLGPVLGAVVLNRGRLWGDQDPEPDVEVKFEHGTIVFLAAREEAYSHYTLELISPNGRLRYEQGGRVIQWQSACADTRLPGYTVLSGTPEEIRTGMDRYQWHVAEQIARALNGKSARLCSGMDALGTLSALKRILNWT